AIQIRRSSDPDKSFSLLLFLPEKNHGFGFTLNKDRSFYLSHGIVCVEDKHTSVPIGFTESFTHRTHEAVYWVLATGKKTEENLQEKIDKIPSSTAQETRTFLEGVKDFLAECRKTPDFGVLSQGIPVKVEIFLDANQSNNDAEKEKHAIVVIDSLTKPGK
ncbi:MAG: hypothetical protein ACKOLA_06220, partial [Spartobacteria bacterium]